MHTVLSSQDMGTSPYTRISKFVNRKLERKTWLHHFCCYDEPGPMCSLYVEAQLSRHSCKNNSVKELTTEAKHESARS